MNPMRDRYKITRRQAVQALGSIQLISLGTESKKLIAGTASPSAAVSEQVVERGWKPQFFTPHQNETVIAISELIIPQTETPGAKAAKVNEFSDLALSEESPEKQQAFLNGLAWMDRRSQDLFGADFVNLKLQQQKTIMDLCSAERTAGGEEVETQFLEDQVGVAFFRDIKRRTIFAYYTSREGIHQELQYKGLSYLAEFPGCRHPEHLPKSRTTRED